MYLELLGKYKNQHGFKLFAFALLPGHAHMLIETGADTTLSDIMHNITSSYTKYYNRKYNRQGHLFRGRFRATLVEKEPYLLKMIRYVHLNPKKVGLENEEYAYSSYPFYAGGESVIRQRLDLKDESGEVAGLLGEKRFVDFMNEGTIDEGMALHRDLHRRLFLGSEEFGKRIQDQLDEKTLKDEDETEESPRVKKIMIPVVSGLLLVALSGLVFVYYQSNKSKAEKLEAERQKAEAARAEQPIDFYVAGLDGSVWQVKFVAGAPLQIIDNLYFENGKMFSDDLSLNGYPESNYSVSKQDNVLVWETMQTSKAGTAFWRGEVEDGRMKGHLNLRSVKGEPQDFSFVSLKYKKMSKTDANKN